MNGQEGLGLDLAGNIQAKLRKFESPCKGPLAFVIKVYLKAPTEPYMFITQNWINFQYINNLTVSGVASWMFGESRLGLTMTATRISN